LFSNKKVLWKCSVAEDHEWYAQISSRSQGRKCPFCSGKRVCNSNCLATLNASLASEWHPTRNDRTPYDVTVGSKYRAWWLCPNCGHEWEATVANRKRTGCSSEVCDSSFKTGANHKDWKGYGEISSSFWSDILRNAKRRSRELPFTITLAYAWDLFLKQDRKCALTGCPLVMKAVRFRKGGYRLKRTASLDRINSTKGYVEGNVQWVHKDVNLMKQAQPESKFKQMCLAVVLYDPNLRQVAVAALTK
jgi:hypothetical protein